MGKIERKFMAHLIDANFGTEQPNWFRIGKDLEEFKVELNPDVETKKNILGETTVSHSGYEESAEVDPYYANTDDAIFLKLQEIVDGRLTGDACKTSQLEVHMWEGDEAEGFVAYKQDCLVIPTSYGGDTSGYQIPFGIHPEGARVKGLYVPGNKTFTPDATEPAAQSNEQE